MKIYLVNISTTAGGVLSNCVSVLYENKELNPKNIEAMKIFLAGGISGGLFKTDAALRNEFLSLIK